MKISNGLLALVIGGLLLVMTGCSAQMEDDSQLTRAQRDSVLAESDLPGAAVVGKALDIADSAAARSERSNP